MENLNLILAKIKSF